MKQQKNEFKIVFISFGVIALVVVLMFIKSNLKQQDLEEKNILETQEVVDKMKDAKSITAENLLQRINSEEKINLIDIRSSNEFKKEHLLDSINISIDVIKENIDKFEKNETYILIDNSDSLEVMNLVSSDFKEKNIVNTYYLKGGLSKWKENFYPTISEGDPNSMVDQSKIKYINTDELKSLMENKKNLLIIDVRGKESYNTEKIPGSVNIPLDELERRVKEITIGKKVILYDDDSFTAFKAGVRLFDLGKFNVFTLSEGFIKWKEKNYPIEK